MVSITDFFKFIMVSNMIFLKFITVSITDFVQISKDEDTFVDKPRLKLEPSTSWFKKMSGGYLVRKSWRWLLGSRISWPPRPSEGGDHLLRHSLDPSPLRSTLIVDKTIAKQRIHLDKYKT